MKDSYLPTLISPSFAGSWRANIHDVFLVAICMGTYRQVINGNNIGQEVDVMNSPGD